MNEGSFNVEVVASKFLAIVPEAKRASAERALALVLPAYAAGSIYNVDYKDANSWLSRVVEAAYRAHVAERFLYGRGYSPESELENKIGSPYGLHACLSGAKKVAKLAPAGEFGDALRSFYDAVTPLAALMAGLKEKVAMGRKPSANPKVAAPPVFPIKTCGCCFRAIAVLPNGRIADHGYRLPHHWGKTGSCPGRRFRPLEVSSDGLVYMVETFTAEEARLVKALAGVAGIKSLIKRKNCRGKVEVITPESPDWARVLAGHVADLNHALARARSGLTDYSKRLTNWKPETEKEVPHA